MSPIQAGTLFRVLIYIKVEVQLGKKQVEVATLQHGPIHQALILGGMHTPTPVTEVWTQLILVSRIDIFRIESKEAAIKLGGPLSSGITTQHIAEQRVVANDRGVG